MADPAQPVLQPGFALQAPQTPAGTLTEHHLDDQPLQPQGEAYAEVLALLPTPLSRSGPALRPPEPRAPVTDLHTGPWLEGPLRPPCQPQA